MEVDMVDGRCGRVWLVAVVLAMAAVVEAGSAQGVSALPASIDGDDDGFIDGIETPLGSDPGDPTSTPESVAVSESCFDGEDNDGDGGVDIDDPGCMVPEPAEGTFPGAGFDVFNSSLSLNGYALQVPGIGTCEVDFEGQGPVVIERQTPAGDPSTIDVEIVAMQLSGQGAVVGGDPNCPVGQLGGAIVEDPTRASSGQVISASLDPTTDFPADSFFDVFFDIYVDGLPNPFPGGPPSGPAGGAVHLQNVINTLPPYHGGKNTLCYEVENQEHEHCPKAPPDHYLCYAAKFSPKFQKRTVTLLDQFDEDGSAGNEERVLTPRLLCNPASKNGEPLYEKTGHLQCYSLKPRKSRNTVVVRNQFGQPIVKTKRSTMLCLPTEKNQEGPPQQLDHFKCYDGKFPRIAKRRVTLVDQFGIVETQVRKRQMLCNPTSKNGEPIRNPTDHLECYTIKPKKVKQTVTVMNQFGTETVKTKKAVAVCLPSGKSENTATTTTVVVTTTTIGDGTTTTTMPSSGGIDLMLGYTHPTPGMPPSVVCGKVTAPELANQSGSVNVQGPDPGSTSVTLNGSGVKRFQVNINSFGNYTVEVNVGGQMVSGMVNVDSPQSTCP
jgi:hypothetical protein